jgi:large subunit ribosomal protein L33|uniref:Large ribosomal subunit protein bL33c n=2 Tax=Cyanidioschyzon merolae TaxID=45157 RepID=RK33_CYAM1|nr:ribosomal protein L33 [Cyanidioschyzon merolae strain 10D]Q85FR9.1 RecName: Full=Large ribosomal subunit protein bL33c; AltName: Full=50S ribosomal protein L33, chloroplastic [Cyanidioschyzon merolae strain 10D]QFV17061.1 50S ribosomal protein L33 [Cyanidioschyzon merolae]QFV17234.1 50S ribosomal protein L33 [Cyanidioschyzon merolae]BAC76276.1 50S ribosomal protein L33 [Cyanidioschyzon merolae strain 10D]
MAKSKSSRVGISLECTACRANANQPGVNRYRTTKNKKNTPNRLELKKFCPYCGHHTIHREIK